MAKLPADFDWRKSPAHIDLLSKFVKARDIAQVMDWQYLKDTIRENTKDAIERFIRDGALVPCELEESLDRVFTAAQLKKMLKEHGLKQSGAKEELIERLVEADRSGMQKLVSRLQIMKCSGDALALIEQHENEKQRDLESAKQQSHNALLNNEPKEAYRIFVSFNRKYNSPDFPSNPYEVGELEAILSSCPKVLGAMTPSDLRSLQAATCMAKLWYGEPATNWLPDGFTTGLKNSQIAVNYLARHAEFKHSVMTSSEYCKRFKIVFEPNDIDSCDLCLALNGKEFDKNHLPELPFQNCTSDTGCMCRIESVFDDADDGLITITFDTEDDEGDEIVENGNAVARLKQLKELLDNGLISQAEFDTKKAEILSRI